MPNSQFWLESPIPTSFALEVAKGAQRLKSPLKAVKPGKLTGWLLLALCLGTPGMAFGLEGKASYYTEASCRREGTSGVWTASGARYDDTAMTCAMRSRQWGKKVKVKSKRTGRTVLVKLTDYGPGKKATARGVVIDLTPAAFMALGHKLEEGVINVEVSE